MSDKAKEGAYYLLYDDLYFEQIDKNTMITREVLLLQVDIQNHSI